MREIKETVIGYTLFAAFAVGAVGVFAYIKTADAVSKVTQKWLSPKPVPVDDHQEKESS